MNNKEIECPRCLKGAFPLGALTCTICQGIVVYGLTCFEKQKYFNIGFAVGIGSCFFCLLFFLSIGMSALNGLIWLLIPLAGIAGGVLNRRHMIEFKKDLIRVFPPF